MVQIGSSSCHKKWSKCLQISSKNVRIPSQSYLETLTEQRQNFSENANIPKIYLARVPSEAEM